MKINHKRKRLIDIEIGDVFGDADNENGEEKTVVEKWTTATNRVFIGFDNGFEILKNYDFELPFFVRSATTQGATE